MTRINHECLHLWIESSIISVDCRKSYACHTEVHLYETSDLNSLLLALVRVARISLEPQSLESMLLRTNEFSSWIWWKLHQLFWVDYNRGINHKIGNLSWESIHSDKRWHWLHGIDTLIIICQSYQLSTLLVSFLKLKMQSSTAK